MMISAPPEHHSEDPALPVSTRIRARIQRAKQRFHANDNISAFVAPGELDTLLEEVAGRMKGVLESLVIDTESDHNTQDTARRVAKMYLTEVFRGRYRTGFEKPAAIVPNQVTEFRYSLHGQNYAFRQGHRIMVQVQSTWFPLIDRNPQTFVPNIFAARASDYRAATHRVYRSASHPSHVLLPLVGARRP